MAKVNSFLPNSGYKDILGTCLCVVNKFENFFILGSSGWKAFYSLDRGKT